MKILVRGTNWIGDAVMSVPALRELRRIFPDDYITLHTRSWAEGLFHDVSFIDEIVPFDPQRWKIREALDNADFLRDDGFELAVLMPNSFESALTSYLTRIPRRIGYNKDLRGLLLTDPVAVPEWKGRRHEAYYYLNLIREVAARLLGRSLVDVEALDTTIEVSEERRNAAEDLLSQRLGQAAGVTIALAVGSANSPEKRWSPEYFAALADQLKVANGCNVILVGSKDDSAIARQVTSRAKGKLIDLTGQTTLEQAVALLSVVDLLISNDAGLAHVSAAVGARTVVIFGPTNADVTRPLGKRVVLVQGSSRSEWPSVEAVSWASEQMLNDEDDHDD